MHEFNLRPWRMLQRRRQSRQLLIRLLLISAATLTFMISLVGYLDQQTQQLQAENQYRQQQIQHRQTGLKQHQTLTSDQQALWSQIQQDRDYVVRLLAKLNPPQNSGEPSKLDDIQLTQIQWQPPRLKLLGQYRSSEAFQQWLKALQGAPLPWVLQAQKRDDHHFSLELTRHD
ncbi:hypothetical protein BFW38_12470 [Terasakiispira papahanaumokuakeensis]|uniref:Uncharacterized protein n=1 Tax=Terasakiispira papahanaumokuakeensis TaxID=197479 RepID=A0A1E2VBC5_9GAMM|nr:hypothetical protein [Terasakiispira papahanaumokuakeensis]ODC04223.1 hypothetical protein BFW38_12470 [Terasakiispira papahanaumokuakeensis]